MHLEPCTSCERLLRTGDACPFCGQQGVPTTFAPSIAAVLLSVPLLAASACTRPAESIYGGPEMLDPVDPPPAASDSTTPVPDQPAEADPAAPSEPQGEIYGSPQMMDSSAEEPPAPAPDSGGNRQAEPDDADEADPKREAPPDEPIYGGPEMLDPVPSDPVPKDP